jgi:hypothetical protein
MKVKYILNIFFLITVLESSCVSKHEKSDTQSTIKTQDAALIELSSSLGDSFLIESIDKAFFNLQSSPFNQDTLADNIQNSIIVPIKKEKSLTFKNYSSLRDETASVAYKYVGYEKKSKLYWIIKDEYEERKNLIIHENTGDMVELKNSPIIDLSGSYLFCNQSSSFMEFEDYDPGFQIWKILAKKLQLIREVRLKNFFVVKGGWDAQNDLCVAIAPLSSLNNDEDQEKSIRYFLIRIRNR